MPTLRQSGPEQGAFHATRQGYGFVTPATGGADLFVPAAATAGALDGDQVRFERVRPRRGSLRGQAAVSEILARGVRHFTGVVSGVRKRRWLTPDHPKLPPLMRLAGESRGVAGGERVLCRLHDARPGHLPSAEVVRVLGDANDPRLDEEIVRAEFALPGAYPAEAVAEAGDPAAGDRAEPFEARRRDFRGETVVTIDPEDARDFDDALSIAPSPGGGWRVRVHIADVSSGVPYGGALDREARQRGNSTYLPGTMIPMLPESLATGAMSLAAGALRRVVTVSAKVSPAGEIRATRVDLGLIRSARRFTYEEVEAILAGEAREDEDTLALLRNLEAFAGALRGRRFESGGFDLQVPEITVRLGPDGRPERIRRRIQLGSHRIVEECMILANRVACAFARKRGHPYIYRVHPAPDPEALETFWADLETLAPGAPAWAKRDLSGLRRYLASLPATPETWRLHAFFLRTLKRATYDAHDTGHFGLGLRGYAHFTSPIRRYPDLYNHRVVKWALSHGTRPVPEAWREEIEGTALHCTGAEERSEQAERALVRIKQLRWAEDHLGEAFRGRVEAVLPRGFVIEFDEPPVAGFAPREEIEGVRGVATSGQGLGLGRGELPLGLPVIAQIVRVDLRGRSLLLTIRAAGRRAAEADPAAFESVIDPWSPAADGRRKGRRGAPKPSRERPGLGKRGQRRSRKQRRKQRRKRR